MLSTWPKDIVRPTAKAHSRRPFPRRLHHSVVLESRRYLCQDFLGILLSAMSPIMERLAAPWPGDQPRTLSLAFLRGSWLPRRFLHFRRVRKKTPPASAKTILTL